MNAQWQSFMIVSIIQALLYGLYVVTLVHCLRWLLYSDEGWSYREDINWPMLTIAVVIFLLSTASLVVVLYTALEPLYEFGAANVSA